eukprot:TRINITY_DN8877_c0_g1_i3.p1 TRINITY_DN8877_c0_g1~~TRINITY_DN8877_c0_g1_i3.p1  ORF type:complete len:171 (+),score=49.33 TRINITY_DN8877_c0_g1_i3:57-569(+)
MFVYVDRFSESDRLLDDTFEKKLIHGAIWEVEGKVVTVSSQSADAQRNADEVDDSLDETVRIVINVVESQNLMETSIEKQAYIQYIKAYMKRIKAVLEEQDPDQADEFMRGGQEHVKEVLARFDDFQFFYGPSMNPEGHVALMFYKEDGITPYFYFWKDGLIAKKVPNAS